MDLGLKGKVVLVTGASRGIGRAVAVASASEGADVAIGARSPDDLADTASAVEALGCRAVAVAGDMADPAEVERLVSAATDRLGGIDALVTCVGSTPLGHFATLAPETWGLAFTTKFMSTVHAIRAVTSALRSRGGGSVVAVAGNSSHAPDPLLATSVVMNSALVGLVGVLARDLAADNISVNAVSPGPVDTPRLTGLTAARAEADGIPLEAARHAIEAAIPTGRVAQPAEIASVVVSLLSPQWRQLTGENIVMDGAQSWSC